MMKKIKIIESNCTPELEKTTNKLLKKGWKYLETFAKGSNVMVVIMKKN